MKFLIFLIFIMVFGLVLAKPMPKPQAPPAAPAAPAPDLSALLSNMPKSGIVGMFDNIGAGLANFGNGQGSAFDAILSGMFNAFGNFISGVLGSGVINTGFLNYNNRPPADSGPATTAKPAGGGAAPAPPADDAKR